MLEEAFQSFPRNTRFAGIINLNLRKAYIAEGLVENFMELIEALLAESRTTFPAESLELAGILITLGIELVEVEEFVQAEGLLRECLAIRDKKSPEIWSSFNAQAILGAASPSASESQVALEYRLSNPRQVPSASVKSILHFSVLILPFSISCQGIRGSSALGFANPRPVTCGSRTAASALAAH